MNAARSALSNVITTKSGTPFGKLPLVCRLLRGVFNIRPSMPKYVATWDISCVFSYLKTQPSVETCDLKLLSHRLVILLCILTAQRDQTLSYFDLNFIRLEEESVTIIVPALLKQSKPGRHLSPIVLKKYMHDKELCVLKHLKVYIQKTAQLRSSTQLLISYVKPHKAVSTSTIGKWCTNVLHLAGIDLSVFSSHSTRSASTSHASKMGVSFREIGKAAGWSKSETFCKYYNKPLVDENYSMAIYNSLKV